MNNWSQRLYLGTWQFSGQFRKLTRNQIIELLDYAQEIGIKRYDTAAVYGGGGVEEIMGEVLAADSLVLTKVPAKIKPAPGSRIPIEDCYDKDWIAESLFGSLKRLRRDSVDTVLLHNWSPVWGDESLELLAELDRLRLQGYVKRIGISLPDGFGVILHPDVVSSIEVIEAPYNLREEWVMNALPRYLSAGREVILRSLFVQGLLTKPPEKRLALSTDDIRREKIGLLDGSQVDAHKTLLNAWRLETSLAVGMTTRKQISGNVAALERSDKNV